MIQKILHLVKLQHSLFAMPFTVAAMLMAAKGLPELSKIFWIIVAFMGARSFGMAANRLIDRKIDSKNPRTAHRLMASGQSQANSIDSIHAFLVECFQWVHIN